MALLFDYQPTYMVKNPLYQTAIEAATEQKPLNDPSNEWFSTNIGITNTGINGEIKVSKNYSSIISELMSLEDNWDDEGAIAPTYIVINNTVSLLSTLDKIGQPINNISTGYTGEVAINLKNGNKVFEIIFYPNKSKFATFNKETNQADQGVYEENTLHKLLNWLNEQQIAA
jgi:hypothetical protein